METLPFIEWCLNHLNYLTITILMAIESSFIPFPSEIIITPAAYQAASDGDMHIALIIFFGTLGSLIGALFNYYLALLLGRPIITAFARSRLGAICLLDEHKVVRAEEFFRSHGSISTLFGRLIPGIRQLISIPAGLSKMGLNKFVLFTILGAGIWNIILALLGYYLASIVPKEELMQTVTKYSHEIGLGMLILAVGIILFLAYKAHKRGKENRQNNQDTTNK